MEYFAAQLAQVGAAIFIVSKTLQQFLYTVFYVIYNNLNHQEIMIFNLYMLLMNSARNSV